MVVVSYSGKEINAKLVYYGPGLSGKTTNLEHIYSNVPNTNRGKMVSMKTRTERTLFFDFLPIDLGDIGGFKTRFLLYTVPGQVYYNATRKLVLRGVDAIIFVADSARDKMAENIESLQNLHDNLSEYGLNLDEIPFVIQYNKRDLPDVYSVEELEKALNPKGVPSYEVVATTGQGVFESFRGIARLLMQKLGNEIKFGDGRESRKTSRPTASAPGKPAAPSTESPISLTPPTPESPAAATPTPPPAQGGEGAPYRPANVGRANREAPVIERGAPPRPVPAAPTPPAPDATPPQPVVSSEDALSLDASDTVTPEAPVADGPSIPAAQPMDSGPDSDDGTWDEAQAAAEDAALEAEISKRQKRADVEHGDEATEDTAESPGFWGRLFGRKAKSSSPLMPEPPEESFETAEFEEADSSPAAEVPEPVIEPSATAMSEPPAPMPVDDTTSSDAGLAAVPAEDLSADAPAVITRHVEVPVTLTAEEIERGARLRLVMEIKVQSAESTDAGRLGDTKVA